MKWYKLLVPGLCLLAAACSNQQPKAKASKRGQDTVSKKTQAIQYTCTMHPEVIATKPGTCPKCGMELIEKDDSK